ncbi:hypothetical protein PoB_003954500 [Plakobranchus ocellatus]|uniref:Uncharacterized protein n=1 Tax=Plakobranchus ocellatus TaxID=259542 RepID=A0AAV4B0G0_9GAST|nr:hypothetical protein PoB_003954500 [Plakobranchus ocellatus]
MVERLKQIGTVDVSNDQLKMKHNTEAKDLQFLRRRGLILSGPAALSRSLPREHLTSCSVMTKGGSSSHERGAGVVVLSRSKRA